MDKRRVKARWDSLSSGWTKASNMPSVMLKSSSFWYPSILHSPWLANSKRVAPSKTHLQ